MEYIKELWEGFVDSEFGKYFYKILSAVVAYILKGKLKLKIGEYLGVLNMKKIALIGPEKSGKTVFVGLMRDKLIDNGSDELQVKEKKYKKPWTENFPVKFSTVMGQSQWPNRTSSEYSEPCKLIFESKNRYDSNIEIKIPDIPGAVLKNYINENTPKEVVSNFKDYLNACDGIIMVLDVEFLSLGRGRNRKVVDNEHCNTHKEFFMEFMKFAKVIDRPKHIKILILLNKSDVVNNKNNDLFGENKSALKFIEDYFAEFKVELLDLFGRENVDFAWHTSIGKVKSKGDGETRPDYEYFKKINYEIYTKVFLDFIGKVIES